MFIALIRFQWVLVAYSLELQGQIEKLLDNYRIAANVTGVSWAICSIIPCYKQEVPQERNYIKIMRPSVWFRTYPYRLRSSSFLGLPFADPKYKPQKGTTMEPMGEKLGYLILGSL